MTFGHILIVKRARYHVLLAYVRSNQFGILAFQPEYAAIFGFTLMSAPFLGRLGFENPLAGGLLRNPKANEPCANYL